MSSINPILGYNAGLRTGFGSTPRAVFWGGNKRLRPTGGLLDTLKTRDVGNTDTKLALRAGLLMGVVTATGRFANSFLGLSSAAYAATATSLTVPLAVAAELLRRNGATGNLSLIGGPTANSLGVTVQTLAYTNINTGTGVITVVGTGTTASVSGSFIGCADGSELPYSFLNDGYPIRIANTDAGTDVPGNVVAWPDVPIGGVVNDDLLIPLATDTGILNWLRRTILGDPATAAGKTQFEFRRAVGAV